MMKNVFSIFFSIFFSFCVQAQDYSLLKEIKVEARGIELDKFGYLYIIEDYKISKYSPEGSFLFSFEENNFGLITKLDITNPLKPFLFFRDFNILLILDQKLSIINNIDLSEKNIDNIETIGQSKGSYFWVFDNNDFKLKKVNKFFELLISSESFSNLFNYNVIPIDVIENENHLIVNTINSLKLFDHYGVYLKSIVLGSNNFQIIDNKIIYLENNTLNSYNIITSKINRMNIPFVNLIISAKLSKGKLIFHKKDAILIYKNKQGVY